MRYNVKIYLTYDGVKFSFRKGYKSHRTNGPAVDYAYPNSKEWWIEGSFISYGDDKPSKELIVTRTRISNGWKVYDL